VVPKRCLLTVHAHPDDEASKGAPTVARLHSEGVHCVLVTCTGGEEGDILNPAMDRPEVRERLAELRREELERAAKIIGYDEVVMLGYRDSGMPGSPANSHPSSFASAPLEETVGRLVGVIRRLRPQVVVAYPRDQSGYPHPDHIRANEVAELAFDAAGDPARYRSQGRAWQPLRLLYSRWSWRRVLAMHDKFLELGLESPYEGERFERMRESAAKDHSAVTLPRITVNVRGWGWVTREALLAHATQVDPKSPWWFGLPPEVADDIWPYDEYEVGRDLTDVGEAPELLAGDLFSGVETA
jgi:mycothiol S-conjugate amidase